MRCLAGFALPTILLLFVLFCGLITTVTCSIPRMKEHPENVTVAKNEPATLRCIADGEPEPEIEWWKDGRMVSTAPKDPSSHRVLLPSGSLFFLRAIHTKKESDSGSYWCKAINEDGQIKSRIAVLDVAALRADFQREPADTSVILGERARIHCLPPKGHPQPTVSWRKDEEDLNLYETGRLFVEGGSLIIDGALESDEGRYQCVARNIAATRTSRRVLLSVNVKPFVMKAPENISADVDDNIKFSCVVGGDPTPEVQWIKEDGKLPPSRSRVHNNGKNALLSIRSVTPSDGGKYTCQAENREGEISSSAFLQIQSPPIFLVRPSDQKVAPGATVRMDCVAKAQPAAMIYWIKEGMSSPLMPGTKHGNMAVTPEGSLHVSSVSPEDQGLYNCAAVSQTGSSFLSVKITVKKASTSPPPIIQLGPVNQTLPVHTQVKFPCQFMSRDQANVSWLKEGLPIDMVSDKRLSLMDGSSLRIKDLQEKDTGLYTCQVISGYGQATWTSSLKVVQDNESDVELFSMPDLPSFPASPSQPKLVNATATSLTISWGKPTRVGSSSLRGYQVEYFTSRDINHWVSLQNIQEEKFTLENLEEKTSVIFLVRAKNEHGLSPPSFLSSEMVTLPRVSKAKSNLAALRVALSYSTLTLQEVIVLGAQKAKIVWETLEQEDLIKGYHIHIQEKSEGSTIFNTITVARGSTRAHTLTHLRAHTQYIVFMAPFSGTVNGKPSNLKSFKTKESEPSGYPEDVEIKLLNFTTAVVSWTRPMEKSINGVLSGYKIEILVNNTLVANYTLEPSSNQLILNNLSSGYIYSFRIAAFNRAGMGPFTEPISMKVDPTLVLTPHHFPNNPMTNNAKVINETWFVSLIGVLAILTICSLIYMVIYARRKQIKDKNFGHYNVYKVDDLSNMNYLESDTLWINTKTGLATGNSLANYTHNNGNHLFINNLCAPEYAEVDGVKATYHNVAPVQGPYASTDLSLVDPHFNNISILSTPASSSTSGGAKCSSFPDDKSSSEDQGGNQSTGETTSGSNGHHTDREKSPRDKDQSPNMADSGSSSQRKRRSKRSHSKRSSSSDSSSQKVPSKKSELNFPAPPSDSEPMSRFNSPLQSRLIHGLVNSPGRCFSRGDIGLPPPAPPARGLSSYNGVRAGSFNSFGVGGYPPSFQMSDYQHSHYSVPGIFVGQGSSCQCCVGHAGCVQGHPDQGQYSQGLYESASIYQGDEGINSDSHIARNEQDSHQNLQSISYCSCGGRDSATCQCQGWEYSSYMSDGSEAESFYADSDFQTNSYGVLPSEPHDGKESSSRAHPERPPSICSTDSNYSAVGGRKPYKRRMVKNGIRAIKTWQSQQQESTYSTFKPPPSDQLAEDGGGGGSHPQGEKIKRHKRRQSDGGTRASLMERRQELRNSQDPRAILSANSSPAPQRRGRNQETASKDTEKHRTAGMRRDRRSSRERLQNSLEKHQNGGKDENKPIEMKEDGSKPALNSSNVITQYSTTVSENLDEMVDKLHEIHSDISELHGRPISIYGVNK